MRISDWSSDVFSSDLYARVVTDFAAFAYIGDVFLASDDARGQGWGSWLMDCVLGHPDLQGLRRWMLMCGERPVPWYKRYGFEEPGRPARSEEHTSELQSLMRISYAVFCLKKKNKKKILYQTTHPTNT